ncbi:peptide MFS transporter [Nevskia ramosa]|uniref:peptide MFS transporter n=2 Tax=Nevskia ramosa TaxID=64002 RepID=UPI0003B61E9F|nr:peptide MFS transporter [Nevskia ramosa]
MSSPTFLGHPRGLATLFFTEMWERFTFYGMRSLLVLFMTAAVVGGNNPGLGLTEGEANAIYGLYLSCVYLFALPGGWIADRLTGQRNAVIAGGLLIAAGNFMLAIGDRTLFFLGLVVIVLGVGLLKPNISAMVGKLYDDMPSSKRDAGFSIFYMGINLGAVAAPLLVGTIGEKISWQVGFAGAGLLMLAGLVQFHLMRSTLPATANDASAKTPEERKKAWTGLAIGVAMFAAFIAAATLGAFDLEPVAIAQKVGVAIVLIAAFFFGYVFLFGKLTSEEAKRVAVILVLFFGAATFFMGFELAGSTFNLFARDFTDRSAFGSFFTDGQHPASWYQSLNPLFVVAFSPVFAALWVQLGKRNLEPSIPAKFALGLIQMGLGFIVIAYAAHLVVTGAEGTKVLPVWLLLTYLLHTFGELCLSPIGLSAVTKLAPPRYVSQMMGTWFAGTALGNLLSGLIAGHLGADDIASAPGRYLMIFALACTLGLLMAIMIKPIKRLMGTVR